MNITLHFGSVPWVSLILALSTGFYGLCKKVVGLTAITNMTLETLLIADYSEHTNYILAEAMQWLQDQGYQVAGALIGRYLTSVHKDSLDYYEIWIPIRRLDIC
jgi:RarD protein